jgi:hypothetical protein
LDVLPARMLITSNIEPISRIFSILIFMKKSDQGNMQIYPKSL